MQIRHILLTVLRARALYILALALGTGTLSELAYAKKKKEPKNTRIGAFAGSPGGYGIEGRQKFGDFISLGAFFTGPLAITIPLDIPSQELVSLGVTRLATKATTLPMDVSYGPNYGADLALSPFGGELFMSAGIMVRQINASSSTAMPVYYCTAADRDCSAGTPTGQSIVAEGSLSSQTLVASASLGWAREFSSDFFVSLTFLGVALPINSDPKAESHAYVAGNDGGSNSVLTPLVQGLTGSLEQEAIGIFKTYDSQILPVVGMTIGRRF